MKLTRRQELSLINLGFEKLLESLETSRKPRTTKKAAWNKGKKGRKWTDAQREKFRTTMRNKWAKRKKSAQ